MHYNLEFQRSMRNFHLSLFKEYVRTISLSPPNKIIKLLFRVFQAA